MVYSFTAVVTREGKFHVSECPELGIASQGLSQDEALENLKEAIGLYLEDEDPAELDLPPKRPLITTIEVAV
jgi:predicted RNase H-like HicB family nuclease